MNDEETKKSKEAANEEALNKDTNKKTAKVAAKGAATYFAPGVGAAAVDLAAKTPQGDKILEKGGEVIDKVTNKSPTLKKGLNKLNESWALDAADQGLSMVGGSPSGASDTGAGATNTAGAIGTRPKSVPNVESSTLSTGSKMTSRTSNGDMAKRLKDSNKNMPDMSSDSDDSEDESDDTSESFSDDNFLDGEDISDDSNTDETEDSKKKQKGSGFEKKAIDFIIKNPWVLGVVAGVFFVLLLMFVILNGSGDGSNKSGNDGLISDCSSGIPIHSTAFTSSEFVSKMKEIADNNSGGMIQTFAANAEMIYRVAFIENKVNPEMVLIRALMEYGSKHGVRSDNNYWGIAVYNGQSSGASYPTLEAGVRGFVTNISKYEDATDMMSRYAYIGEYWYNPGSSGLGGCYYAPYIYSTPPSHVAVACGNSAPSCSKGGGAGCTKTTDDDQQAYAAWQVSKMTDLRQKYFGVGSSTCEEQTYAAGGLAIPTYYQDEYSDKVIKKCATSKPRTIATSGCGPTSFAMVISYLTKKAITPPDVIYWCDGSRCGYDSYVCNGGYSHDFAGIFYEHYKTIYPELKGNVTQSGNIEDVKNALMKGNPVISLQHAGLFTSGGHYIVLRGYDKVSDTFLVNDPNKGNAINKNYINRKFTSSEINASNYIYYIFNVNV